MSQVLDIFTVDSLQENEMAFYNITNSWFINDHRFMSSLPLTPPSEIPLSQTYNSSNIMYWPPSDELQKVLRLLYKEDYAQFPCVSYSYFSRLLYPPTICKMDSQK